jgi:hypothetical protein
MDQYTRTKIARDMEESRARKEVMLANALKAHTPAFEEACLLKALQWEESENYFRQALAEGVPS